MKLTVLVDNNLYPGHRHVGEHGFSCHIEDGSHSILFDTGYSDIFMRNAANMDIDLNGLTDVVLSHGHDDHTGGLRYLTKRVDMRAMTLTAHPDAFDRRIINGREASCPLSAEELRQKCTLRLSREPVRITDNLLFLGGIPQLTDQARVPLGRRFHQGRESDDYVLDDSALVYRSAHGLFILTGCAHSGICNIVAYARQVCRTDEILGILGGFHLQKANETTRAVARFFMEAGVRNLFPCHCVSFQAKAILHAAIPINEVGVGITLEL